MSPSACGTAAAPASSVPASAVPASPGRPAWMRAVEDAARGSASGPLSRWLPPPEATTRPAAVLLLFGAGADGAGEVVLIERAADMRSHPGQVAFPGGAVDPEDDGPRGAALREAREETGLDPAGVDVVAELPPMFLPPSGFAVTPVVAWWRAPGPLRPGAVEEVARVVRVPLPELLDPAHRFVTRLRSGYVGPAFEVSGLFVWGFTAGLLSQLLALAGLERPWDESRERPVPAAQLGSGREVEP